MSGKGFQPTILPCVVHRPTGPSALTRQRSVGLRFAEAAPLALPIERATICCGLLRLRVVAIRAHRLRPAFVSKRAETMFLAQVEICSQLADPTTRAVLYDQTGGPPGKTNSGAHLVRSAKAGDAGAVLCGLSARLTLLRRFEVGRQPGNRLMAAFRVGASCWVLVIGIGRRQRGGRCKRPAPPGRRG
jgi:hypothetical protein